MIQTETHRKAFQELLKVCETKRPKFKEFDEFKWRLKGLIDKIIIDEEWKVIEGFHYSISNYGRIRNDKTKLIKEVRSRRWELKTDIYQDGKRYTVNIKRITAEYFVVFRKLRDDERVRCIDGDSRNTYYKNLEVVSM